MEADAYIELVVGLCADIRWSRRIRRLERRLWVRAMLARVVASYDPFYLPAV
jgi:hypothetical protein